MTRGLIKTDDHVRSKLLLAIQYHSFGWIFLNFYIPSSVHEVEQYLLNKVVYLLPIYGNILYECICAEQSQSFKILKAIISRWVLSE